MGNRRYRLEPARVRAGFDYAAPGYDKAAVLDATVRDTLLQRLDYVQLEPRLILDVGAGTAAAARPLNARYPQAAVVALDFSTRMLRQAPVLPAGASRVCANALQLPFPAASVDVLFSNLMLPWCDDLDGALSEFARVTAPGALLTLSTYGPDTLRELRSAWWAADRCEHVNAFVDMHDLGDALGRAGFGEAVIDVDRYTLTYADSASVMRDLRAAGSANALPGRERGLVGRTRYARVVEKYESLRVAGRLPATYEVVYAHAWRARARAADPDDGIARIPVERIGRR